MSNGIWSVVSTYVQNQPILKPFRWFELNPYLEVKHTEVDSSFSWEVSEYN